MGWRSDPNLALFDLAHFGRAQHLEKTPKTGWWKWTNIDFLPSGYDIHSLPWKINTMLKNGEASISIRAIYTMAMLVITRGYHISSIFFRIPEWRAVRPTAVAWPHQGDNFLLSVLDFRDLQCRVALSDFGAPGRCQRHGLQ